MDFQEIEFPTPYGFQESILESINIAIMTTDLNGNILTINKAAEEMWEFPKSIALGRSFLLCLAEHERPRMQRTFNHVIKHERGLKASGVVFQNRAGQVIYINSFASIFRNAAGEKLGVVMWTENVSEEKKLEKEAKIASMLNQIVLESIGTGILAVDVEGKILTINKAAEEMYNFPKEEAIGTSYLLGLAEHERPRFKKTHDYVVRTEKVFRGTEIKLMNRAGRTLYINAYSSLIKSPSGKKLGVAMLTEDITRRKKLEAEVQRADKLAALGQLSLGISHEIRTPLGTIKALAALVRDNVDCDQKTRKYMNIITNQVDHLDELSRELLEFAGKANLGVEKININKLLNRVLFLSKLHEPLRKAKIKEDIQEKLPPVKGDKEMLMHAFINLLINAMEATGHQDTITLSAFSDDQYVTVKIEDTGVGIPAPCLDKIFDPFYTTKDNGTGLGLSIVHTIISNHQGHIEVGSVKDQGTVFTVLLPVGEGEE